MVIDELHMVIRIIGSHECKTMSLLVYIYMAVCYLSENIETTPIMHEVTRCVLS
jgi:hypothetical protein